MSYIWNVILSFSSAEFWHEDEPQDNCEALNKINEWLLADKVHLYGPLMDLTACANGNETGMSANVYGGGFKRFDIEEFIEVVARQEWQALADVQLFVQGEEAETFTMVRLFEPEDEDEET